MSNNDKSRASTAVSKTSGSAPGGPRKKATPGSTRPPAKAKYGPSRPLEGVEWVGEASMKDAFSLTIGSATGPVSWTFHRPIGVSGIRKPEFAWVATFTPEVAFLLERKEPPQWKTWNSKRDQAIRDAALEAKKGRITDSNGVTRWNCKGSPPCGEAITSFQAAAKAAGKNQSEWLEFAPQDVKVQEAVWKDALKKGTPSSEWLGENPMPTELTTGGPLGTTQQQPVAFLQGKDHRSARDSVMRRALGLI